MHVLCVCVRVHVSPKVGLCVEDTEQIENLNDL